MRRAILAAAYIERLRAGRREESGNLQFGVPNGLGDPVGKVGRDPDAPKLGTKSLEDPRLEPEFTGALMTSLEMRPHVRGFFRAQLAIQVVVQSREGFVAGQSVDHLGTSPCSTAADQSAFCSSRRARWRRDRTVPIGMPIILAIS